MKQNDKPTDLSALKTQAAAEAQTAGMPLQDIETAMAGDDYFSVLEWLIPRRGDLPAESVARLQQSMESLLRMKAYAHPAQFAKEGEIVPIVFGTGGHRGEIGRGITLAHLYAIVGALLEIISEMTRAERAIHFGAGELAEVKRRGFLIGHDNRMFNPEFSFYVARMMEDEGYRIAYAGRVSSPELSRVVPLQGWAGSINFTPSHNPFRYGGIKINPTDGGLAGNEITDPLADKANRILKNLDRAAWPTVGDLTARIEQHARKVARVDVHTPYLEALENHPVIRLGELCERLRNGTGEDAVRFVVDPVWGAAVPVYERLLQRIGGQAMTLIHTEDDAYFGGQTTEPNPQTLSDALGVLQADPARFKVAIRNDPDGDRGLVGDGGGAIKMNRYAALVMRYLMDLGQSGDMATTIPTSHFGPDYARSQGSTVHLTPTGFKNFRPFLQAGTTLLAYEESDGLTIGQHSLDKDGVMAGLLALRIVLHYRRSLTELLADIEAEMGVYHWEQKTFMIEMSAREAKEKLKRLGDYGPGQEMGSDGGSQIIAEVNDEDGYKFIFENGNWLMMRPSGTEPKLRIYAETRQSAEATRALCELGERIARDAVYGP